MFSIEKLRRFKLFSGLGHDDLKMLAMTGEDITIPEDSWLFVEGEYADSFYLILSGTVDLKMSINSAREHQADLERLTEYEAFGWSALVQPHIYTLSAYVVEETRLLVISAEAFLEMMERNPEAGYRLMTRMSETIRRRLANMHVRFVSLQPVP